MPRTLSVGLLGATGLLGQTYAHLLHKHPWFSLTFASSSKPGLSYQKAVESTWHYPHAPPDLSLSAYETLPDCPLLFSTLPAEVAATVEPFYAQRGYTVISHASCFRQEPDIPLILPEINADHLKVIALQQQKRGWKGALICKPNCTLPSFLLPLYPLLKLSELEHLYVTTQQSRSGLGLNALAQKTPFENVYPSIDGEEQKTQDEPKKILGKLTEQGIEPCSRIKIAAHCTRVSVPYGHLAHVNATFKNKLSPQMIETSWKNFSSLELPSSPERLFSFNSSPLYPQPQLETAQLGMGIALGQLRTCPIGDIRFTGLSHNVIRGGSGGGLLIAELMLKEGYFDSP